MIVRNKLSVEDIKRVTSGFIRGFIVSIGLEAVVVALMIRFDTVGALIFLGIGGFILLVSALIHLLPVLCSGTLMREAVLREGNFFLHDGISGSEIQICQLDINQARDKLHRYMRLFLNHGKMYLGNLFDDNVRIPECFKPLFCYDILITLAEEGKSTGSMVLLSNGDIFARTFYDYLAIAGDAEIGNGIADFVNDYKVRSEFAAADFLNFVREKREYLEERFMAYINDHIREFD